MKAKLQMDGNLLHRALTHPALVLGCTLMYGVRELLALQRLRLKSTPRPVAARQALQAAPGQWPDPSPGTHSPPGLRVSELGPRGG